MSTRSVCSPRNRRLPGANCSRGILLSRKGKRKKEEGRRRREEQQTFIILRNVARTKEILGDRSIRRSIFVVEVLRILIAFSIRFLPLLLEHNFVITVYRRRSIFFFFFFFLQRRCAIVVVCFMERFNCKADDERHVNPRHSFHHAS